MGTSKTIEFVEAGASAAAVVFLLACACVFACTRLRARNRTRSEITLACTFVVVVVRSRIRSSRRVVQLLLMPKKFTRAGRKPSCSTKRLHSQDLRHTQLQPLPTAHCLILRKMGASSRRILGPSSDFKKRVHWGCGFTPTDKHLSSRAGCNQSHAKTHVCAAGFCRAAPITV